MENLPLGYRFYPTEEELVHFYLRKKLDGMTADLNQLIQRIIPTLDIYEFNPWDLPQFSGEPCQGDSEQWFFFIPRKESEARGGRPNRLTTFGYWKATGSPGYVYSSGSRIIGFKRTMVFYKGRAPRGNKTDWKMNEYMALEGGWDHESSNNSSAVPYQLRQEYSVCRVYIKTKSLRAFDRRPTADVGGGSNYLLRQVFDGDLQREEATTTPTDRDYRYQHHQMTCNDGINPPQEVERTVLIDSSSPDSSSSFDEVGHGDRVAGCINDEPTLAMDDIDTIWGWIEGSVDAN